MKPGGVGAVADEVGNWQRKPSKDPPVLDLSGQGWEARTATTYATAMSPTWSTWASRSRILSITLVIDATAFSSSAVREDWFFRSASISSPRRTPKSGQ